MNKNSSTRLLATLTLIAILSASFLALIQVQPAQASVRTVTLTIDNRSTSGLSLWLTGDYRYSLSTPSKTKQAYTINQGKYDYTLKGCGMTVKGKLELKQDTLMINPVCGAKVRTVPADRSKISLGEKLNVTPVTIESELTYQTFVVLTGPSPYVFTLKPGQELDVTIGKGTYTATYYACGVNVKKSFEAYKNAKLYLRCP